MELRGRLIPAGRRPSRGRRRDPGVGEEGRSTSVWRSPFVRSTVENVAVPVVFTLVTAQKVAAAFLNGSLGIDFRIYRAAARAVLDGGDPWLISVAGFRFAGPPPSLLPYFPAALVPEAVGAVVAVAIAVTAAVVVVRSLNLPWWWLLFPPLAESVVVLNPDVLVVMLLVCGGRATGLSTIFKIYAAVPLLLQRRFSALALGVAVGALTLPLWPTFIADAGIIAETFRTESTALSSWGTILIVPAGLAIVALRHRGGEWLAVPALWPYTQLHYAALALPALGRRPLLAIALSFAYPLLPPIAIMGQAAWEYWRGRDRVDRLEPAQAVGQWR